MLEIGNIKSIKYFIDNISMIVPGRTSPVEILNDKITIITIEKDYDSFLPVLRINCMISPEIYSIIVKNYNKLSFNINIYTSVNPEADDTKNDNPFSYKRSIIKGLFRLAIEDVNPMVSEELANMKTEEDEEDVNNKQDKHQIPYALYLFNEEHVRKYREVVNIVAQNSNVITTLFHVFNKVGIRNILLSDVDNKSSYEQIIIPPYNLLGIINYLQNVYGLYNHGFISFQDFDRFYLISKKAQCDAYSKGEYRKIFFNSIDASRSDGSKKSGFYEDIDTNSYIINFIQPVEIKNYSHNEKDLRFNQLIVVDSFTGNVNKKDINLNGYGDYKTPKIFHNNYSNAHIENAIKNEMEENNNVFVLPIENIDFSLLTINKEYYITFENINLHKSYGGSCRLSKTYTILSKKMDHFIGTTTIELKKI